ncbi:MAG: hypothetical protein ACOYLE_06915 [Bacteroidales bacterium]
MATQYDKIVFEKTQEFLYKLIENKDLNREILDKYMFTPKFNSLEEVYQRLLESAVNRNRSQGVIAVPLGGVINLKGILKDFNVQAIIKKFKNPEEILNLIKKEFKLNDINEDSKGLWVIFSKTILDGVKFLSKFKDFNDFDNFVMFFHNDERARNALPLLLKQEIRGFGLALACDFLKESGYFWYAKPDVWLMKIFKELNLSQSVNDYDVLNAIIRVAEKNNITPYEVDKAFWLIGSGKLYKDIDLKTNKATNLGAKGKNIEEYLKFVKSFLQ